MSESRLSGQHVPVTIGEVLELLDCRPGGIYADCTVGGGGYAEAILERTAPDGIVVGLDWDAEAIARVRESLGARFGARLLLEQADFADIFEVLSRLRIERIDGIAADLGVSSYQLEDPERGFSFMHDGPLDMRMNRDLPLTAAGLVNTLPEKELADLIYRYGEERLSRRIARAIVSIRRAHPFSSTRELSEVIVKAVPRARGRSHIHPATRTFQALRIAVNHELDSIERFLPEGLNVLKEGGRMCVVAFHSLEDRIVKVRFREWARPSRKMEEPASRGGEGEKPLVRLLTKKALRPGPDEVAKNPRARSARVRAVEKLG